MYSFQKGRGRGSKLIVNAVTLDSKNDDLQVLRASTWSETGRSLAAVPPCCLRWWLWGSERCSALLKHANVCWSCWKRPPGTGFRRLLDALRGWLSIADRAVVRVRFQPTSCFEDRRNESVRRIVGRNWIQARKCSVFKASRYAQSNIPPSMNLTPVICSSGSSPNAKTAVLCVTGETEWVRRHAARRQALCSLELVLWREGGICKDTLQLRRFGGSEPFSCFRSSNSPIIKFNLLSAKPQ
jgi:hypothetical protein